MVCGFRPGQSVSWPNYLQREGKLVLLVRFQTPRFRPMLKTEKEAAVEKERKRRHYQFLTDSSDIHTHSQTVSKLVIKAWQNGIVERLRERVRAIRTMQFAD